MADLFGSTVALLARALDFRALQHGVVAANLANVDTPNYRAQEVRFESQLKRAMDGARIVATNPRHLSGGSSLRDVRPEVVEVPGQPRSDGNLVDIDREMTKLAENHLMYNATVQMLTKQLQSIRLAIQEGGQLP